eukprot:COSAG01_NODE_1569_length_9870_cov_27.746699_4_plen_72_part_00
MAHGSCYRSLALGVVGTSIIKLGHRNRLVYWGFTTEMDWGAYIHHCTFTIHYGKSVRFTTVSPRRPSTLPS